MGLSPFRRMAAGFVFLAGMATPANANNNPADFQHWLSAAPGRRVQVQKFEQFLRTAQVARILPLNELLLSASHWQACGAVYPYELAPREDWPHIVPTLKFVRARVIPTIGPVDAVSGYRSPALGKCAGGAPKSAHGGYYALDLVPKKSIPRAALIQKMCAVHAQFGQEYAVGLGFYDRLRFHVDTKGTRLWGSDFHAATSPCLVPAGGGAIAKIHPVTPTREKKVHAESRRRGDVARL